MEHRSSFLSERVCFLICELNEDFLKEQDANFLCSGNYTDENHLKDFNFLAKDDINSIDFVQSMKNLLPTCHAVHNHLKELTTEEFNDKYGMDLEWTNYRERIVECLTMLKSEDSIDHILSLLLMFPILEHCLGDLYLSITKFKSCPSNLKELLVAKEIQDVIGEDVAMVLYIMAGPPQGLNLRNVVWHGFVSESEIPQQYGTFIIYLMALIGKRLNNHTITRRPMITLPNLDPLVEVFSEMDIVSAFCETLSCQQHFIPLSMKRIWEKALLLYKEKKYGFAMVVILPQLEHLLRMLFAWANQCPERVLTAESTTLFTTFDEILASSLPEGSENQLRIKMGDKYIELLLDVLVHSEGPRLRDHLSHGELELDSISHRLCHHMFCICLVFAISFGNDSSSVLKTEGNACDSPKTFSDLQMKKSIERSSCVESRESYHQVQQYLQQQEQQQVHPSRTGDVETCLVYQANSPSKVTLILTSNVENTLSQLVKISQNYQSVYHPFAILKREINSISQLLEGFNKVAIPDEFLVHEESNLSSPLCNSSQEMETMQKALEILDGAKVFPVDLAAIYFMDDIDFSKQMKLLCDEFLVKTLYRSRRELEVLSLLRRIVKHCFAMATQVLEMANQRYHQYQNKQLRSRQRNNYKRLTTLLKFYCGVVKVALLMVAVELYVLQTVELEPGYVRFLKRCLQYSENMESLSSPTKNRWDECKTACDQLLKNITDYYSDDKTTKDRVFEMREVAKHCSEDDVWIVIDDKVYDVTSYVTRHPGGRAILRNAGGYATHGFRAEKSHGIVKSHIENLLKMFYVGKVRKS